MNLTRMQLKKDDRRLAGTRYAWLKDSAKQSRRQRDAFERLRGAELKRAKAWAIGASLGAF